MLKKQGKALPLFVALIMVVSLVLSPMAMAVDGTDDGQEQGAETGTVTEESDGDSEGSDDEGDLDNDGTEGDEDSEGSENSEDSGGNTSENEPGSDGEGSGDGDDEGDGDGDEGEPEWGGDLTPPVIKSITFPTESIEAGSKISIEFDLEEDESGVDSIYMHFRGDEDVNGETNSFSLYYYSSNDDSKGLLYTDEHVLDFNVESNIESGTYTLSYIDIEDRIGNSKHYSYWDWEDGKPLIDRHTGGIVSYNTVELNVISDYQVVSAPTFNSVNLLTSEVTCPGTIEAEVDFNLGANNSKIQEITLGFTYDTKYGTNTAYLYSSFYRNALDAGKHILTFKTDSELMPPGEAYLSYIELQDSDYSYRSYGWAEGRHDEESWEYIEREGFYSGNMSISSPKQIITVTESDRTDISTPIVNNIELKTNAVKVPGTLDFALDFSDESGLSNFWVSLRYYMTDGSYAEKDYNYHFDEPVASNEDLLVSIPMTIMMPSTKYEVVSFWLSDRYGQTVYYDLVNNEEDENNSKFHSWVFDDYLELNERTVTISNNYKILLDTTIDDGGLAEKIEALPDGSTATVDYGRSSDPIAEKEVFEALAGADKTIIFYDTGQEVQWVFNGKDIDSEKCKDVDLSLWISGEAESWMGVEEGESVVALDFADNGTLPGPATVRVLHSQLQSMHKEQSVLYLHSFDDWDKYARGEVETLAEPGTVTQAADLYSELTVSHNSTYFITASKTPEPVDGYGEPDDREFFGDEHTYNGVGNLEVTINQPVANFAWIMYDGIDIEEDEHFTIAGNETTTTVTFLETWLQSLKKGKYQLLAAFGEAEAMPEDLDLVWFVLNVSDDQTGEPGDGGDPGNGGTSSGGESGKYSYKPIGISPSAYTGAQGGLTFTIDAPYSDLLYVTVDGTRLTKDVHYTAREGSTVITLLDSYLATLSAGNHILRAYYEGGEVVEMPFAISSDSGTGTDSGNNNGSGSNSLAKTGDEASAIWYFVFLATLAAAVCAVAYFYKTCVRS